MGTGLHSTSMAACLGSRPSHRISSHHKSSHHVTFLSHSHVLISFCPLFVSFFTSLSFRKVYSSCLLLTDFHYKCFRYFLPLPILPFLSEIPPISFLALFFPPLHHPHCVTSDSLPSFCPTFFLFRSHFISYFSVSDPARSPPISPLSLSILLFFPFLSLLFPSAGAQLTTGQFASISPLLLAQ